MKDRLHKAFEELRYRKKVKTQTEFAEALGYTKAHFSQVMNGAQPIADKLIEKLETKFGINKEWFKTGEGEMFNDTDVKAGKSKEVIPLGKHRPLRLTPEQYAEAFGDWKGLPMYNTPVTASFVETYRDDKLYQPQYYLHDPRFRDCDFGAIITGDSMHSEIRHGDFIACKEVTDKRFIVYGDIYYVVATNGLETCKYLNADKHDPNNFMLIAKNDNISPSPIPKDMILRLYKVRGIIRGY